MTTTGMTFFDLDWLNRSAEGVICIRCGFVHTFMGDARPVRRSRGRRPAGPPEGPAGPGLDALASPNPGWTNGSPRLICSTEPGWTRARWASALAAVAQRSARRRAPEDVLHRHRDPEVAEVVRRRTPPHACQSSTTPIRAIVSRQAEKPPMLTNPLARPDASTGMNVRARSKPTIDAGPPVAISAAPARPAATAAPASGRSEHDAQPQRHRGHDAEHDPRAVEGAARRPARASTSPLTIDPAGHHHQQRARRRPTTAPRPRTRNG